jgi:hypothetical protein
MQLSIAALLGFVALGPRVVSGQACPAADLPAYSHNDYENTHPLKDALDLGYRGVEADLFLVDGELRVGHDRKHARSGQPFELLYLKPLAALQERCGTLTGDQHRPFLLTVELKEKSNVALDSLSALIGRYPSLRRASSAGRPVVELILVSWWPDSTQLSRSAALAFDRELTSAPDQPMEGMPPWIRLISVNYGKSVSRFWRPASSRRTLLARVRAVRLQSPDRLIRAHNVPADADTYRELLHAGVDLIGTKTLQRSRALLLKAASDARNVQPSDAGVVMSPRRSPRRSR